MVVDRDGRSLLLHMDVKLGARVGLEGEHIQYVEAQHRAAKWQPKVNRGHATQTC